MDSRFKTQATQLDAQDELSWLANHFARPQDLLYFDGNSLGLLSHESKNQVIQALDAWQNLAVSAWTEASPPWFTFVEQIADQLGSLLGTIPGEITLGASTTVMLHQLLATYYRPEGRRTKILIDGHAFPTDRYAAASFLALVGQPVKDSLVIVPPREDRWLHLDDILHAADDTVVLAILPSVVFTTGQSLSLSTVTDALRARGIMTIWDLSHSAGLIPHRLHDANIDAAVFCTYKYLNGGPGAPGGAFVHQNHWPIRPGLAGWWGSHNTRQFLMPEMFAGADTTHVLQLGTPSILSLAALSGSVELLTKAGIDAIYRRSQALVNFLEEIVQSTLLTYGIKLVTPPLRGQRGGHITLSHPHGQALSQALRAYGVVPDFRYPDMVRLSPAPAFTRFSECAAACDILEHILREEIWQDFDGHSSTVT